MFWIRMTTVRQPESAAVNAASNPRRALPEELPTARRRARVHQRLAMATAVCVVVATAAACGGGDSADRTASQSPASSASATGTGDLAGKLCEHSVPESKCTKCDPKLVAAFVASGDYCREHGFPESVCPECRSESTGHGGHGHDDEKEGVPEVVRLASPDAEAEAGIETRRVETRVVSSSLEVIGRLDYDQNRLASLSARGEALVLEAGVDVGDQVQAGQTLLVLASAAVGEGQARLRAAEARLAAADAAFERERALVQRSISPRRSLEEAERERAAAKADRDAALSALAAAGASPGTEGGRYALRAPFAGTVVVKRAVEGKSAAPGEMLVQVADLSRLWALLDVPESDAGGIRKGQPVALFLDGANGRTLEGRISRVAPEVDPTSRTVSARVELSNPDGWLRKGAFLRARIDVSRGRVARVVPAEAVQHTEGKPLVFVREGPGVFAPARVELGVAAAGGVEILGGVDPAAEVVTTGAFLLKTELLKESIGAGCGDHR